MDTHTALNSLEAKKQEEINNSNKLLSENDPLLSKYFPSITLGAVSEKFQHELETYMAQNVDGILEKEKKKGKKKPKNSSKLSSLKFQTLMWIKYTDSLAQPGENVGTIAGQSVGEPSTQMTLNTFHMAGQGGFNVTLGIPRLREILMTASANIKTPTMTLPCVWEGEPGSFEQKQAAQLVARSLNCVILSNLVSKIQVTESLTASNHSTNVANHVYRNYVIRLHLYPLNRIADHFGVQMSEILWVTKTRATSMVELLVKKMLKRAGSQKPDIGFTAKANKDKNESAESTEIAEMEDQEEEKIVQKGKEMEDDDEQGTLRFGKKKMAVSYEDEDAGEDKIDEEDVEIDGALKGKQKRKKSRESGESGESGESESENKSQVRQEKKKLSKSVASIVPVVTASTHTENQEAAGNVNFSDDPQSPWVEFQISFPANYPKLLMLEIAEVLLILL